MRGPPSLTIDERRRQYVLAMRAANPSLPVRSLGLQIGVAESTIRGILRKYHAFTDVQNKPGTLCHVIYIKLPSESSYNPTGQGCKRAFSARWQRRLVSKSQKNPFMGAACLAKAMQDDELAMLADAFPGQLKVIPKKASPSSVRRYLKDAGVKSFRAVTKPYLSPRNTRKRFLWSTDMTNFDWTKVFCT